MAEMMDFFTKKYKSAPEKLSERLAISYKPNSY